MNETPYSDLNIDIETGTRLFAALDVTPNELSNPILFGRLKEVAEFLSGHPDPDYVISRVYNNKSSMSNLDYLANIAQLSQKKVALKQEMEKIDEDLKLMEG